MPTGLTQLQKRQLNLGHVDTLVPITEDPPGNQVIVVGGSYLNDETLQLEQLATQASPSFSPVAPGQERWDLVYVDTSNVIQKSVGTPQALGGPEFTGVPTPPEWAIPLAYVHVTETGTVVVEQEDITDIRPFLRQPNHRDQSGKASTFHDTPQVDHDKSVPSDWDSPTTPQPVDVLLDELAERITDATFTGLTDTPGSYAGNSLDLVRVNAGETGLEFFAAPAFTASRVNKYAKQGSRTGDGLVSLVWSATENPEEIPPEYIKFSLRFDSPVPGNQAFNLLVIEVFRVWDAGAQEFAYIAHSIDFAASENGVGDNAIRDADVDGGVPNSTNIAVASGDWYVLVGTVGDPNLRFRWIKASRTLEVDIDDTTASSTYTFIAVNVIAVVEQLF